jgi:hypothetical protein
LWFLDEESAKVASAAKAEELDAAYRRPEGLLHPVRDARIGVYSTFWN